MCVCLSLFMGGGKGKKDNHAKWTTNSVKKYLNTKYTCLLTTTKCRSDDFINDTSPSLAIFSSSNLNFVLYLKIYKW